METIFGIGIVVIIILIGLLCRELKLFCVKFDEIEVKKMINGESVKIAFLSDLHNYSYGNDNSELVEAIRESRPDIIIISGDMIIAKPNRRDYDVALRLLERLPSIAPVYYANGNHEFRMKIYMERYGDCYDKYIQKLRDYGIHLLENQSEIIIIKGNKFNISGLEIDREYYKRGKQMEMSDNYITDKIGKVQNNCINLLIAHNPIYFPEYEKWGADITFSGHLHGGLVRVPGIGGIISPQLELFPKYDAGIYDRNGKKLVLSRGLGTHTIHIRVFNRAELKVLTLRKEH